ncbi:hypothetical protein AB0K09_26190 [Streptomyces sp. NPDC049577]|uniref:hypothetical protein n=1 Tax=Streptomyces sp. NPDC049577 TaxID=3155153 RepID=UPI00343CDF80
MSMPAKPWLRALDWTMNPAGVAEVWGLFQGPLVDDGVPVKLSDEHDRWKMLTFREWAPLLPPFRVRVLTTAVDMLRNGGCTYLKEGEGLGQLPEEAGRHAAEQLLHGGAAALLHALPRSP